jgi:predicted DNA-binding transcriptional regulator YafY
VRASRLVSILLLLQARGRLTADQLAEELEVSVRTVYRDVEALSGAGVPLYGEAGHEGGYRLIDGYRTRLTGLARGEAESLFLVGLPGPASELGLGPALATAQLKLMAALPEELRDRAGRLQQRFHLDTANWYADNDLIPQLASVVEAVWNQREIQVRYRRWAVPHDVERTLRPYGLVLKGGRWYLVAGGPHRIRTYRISQLTSVETSEDRFEWPDGFDLAAYWVGYLAEFDVRRYQGEATVRLATRILDLLPQLVEPFVLRAVEASARPDGDGWVRAVIPIESVDYAAGLLLRLGVDAQVLAPAELHDHMVETITTLAATYRVAAR